MLIIPFVNFMLSNSRAVGGGGRVRESAELSGTRGLCGRGGEGEEIQFLTNKNHDSSTLFSFPESCNSKMDCTERFFLIIVIITTGYRNLHPFALFGHIYVCM